MAGQAEPGEEAQGQALGTVQQFQEAVVKAVETWSKSVSRLVPNISSLPVGDQGFNPAQAVDNAFDMAQQLLATQRQFSHDVFSAMWPAMHATEEATPDTGTKQQSGASPERRR